MNVKNLENVFKMLMKSVMVYGTGISGVERGG